MVVARDPKSGKEGSLSVHMLLKSLIVLQFAYILLAKAIHKVHPCLRAGEIGADSLLEKGRIVVFF